MGRRETSLNDFALGGRRVPWWAVMASIIASGRTQRAATFLGAPARATARRAWPTCSSSWASSSDGSSSSRLSQKPYFAYKVYTVYDYLGVRFGPLTKGYVSALFLFMRTLASGTRLFIPSLVMVLATACSWRVARWTSASRR